MNGELDDAIKLVRATRGWGTDDDVIKGIIAVSYTHLTLPTSDLV